MCIRTQSLHTSFKKLIIVDCFRLIHEIVFLFLSQKGLFIFVRHDGSVINYFQQIYKQGFLAQYCRSTVCFKKSWKAYVENVCKNGNTQVVNFVLVPALLSASHSQPRNNVSSTAFN